jgi:SulP family sulfate permease
MSDTPVGTVSETQRAPFGRLALFPPAHWLSVYRREWVKSDLIAGVTLAAYAVPVSLAYATLAGLPPQHGIFCYLLGGLCYAVIGTSRQLAIGPTSAISMLVGTTLAGMAIEDPARWVAIATLTALVVAGICLLAWFFRLSVLVSFISETVLVGFKAGAALTIALTQLPKLFGVPGGGEHFFERLWILGGQIPDMNLVVLFFGLIAIISLFLGNSFLPGRPVALGVVVLSIIVMTISSLDERCVTVVGELPRGLPEWQLPSLRLRDVDGVIPLATACFLLAYIEGVSAARAIAQKHAYEINSRQELLALGAANLGVAFGQVFPVAGGLSQSAVNDQAGAKTPLALIFASTTLAICLIFLTELLKNLPNVVLASIVFVAVSGLINLDELRRLWKVSRVEFHIAMVALAAVLLVGILNGVLLAVAASLLMIISRTARPHVAFLGRIPGTRRYSDLSRHPDNEPVPGVLLFRVEASLLYFNVEHVSNVVRQKLGNQSSPVQLVLCDLSTSPYVDTAGARMLMSLHHELKSRGIHFRLTEAHASVRDILRAEGFDEQIGQIDRRISVDDIIQQWPQL